MGPFLQLLCQEEATDETWIFYLFFDGAMIDSGEKVYYSRPLLLRLAFALVAYLLYIIVHRPLGCVLRPYKELGGTTLRQQMLLLRLGDRPFCYCEFLVHGLCVFALPALLLYLVIGFTFSYRHYYYCSILRGRRPRWIVHAVGQKRKRRNSSNNRETHYRFSKTRLSGV